MWRSNYDMPPDEFAKMVDGVWDDLKPLYLALHTYVRSKLNEKYGDAVQPATGPIRADLLGNMWAQEVGQHLPAGRAAGLRATSATTSASCSRPRARGRSTWSATARGSTPRSASRRCPRRSGPARCSSSRPTARWSATRARGTSTTRTTCASRCASRSTPTTSTTIHHELGHNYYQRAYNQQDYLHLNGANDGFHEAIGDFVALSITPEYLVQIGPARPQPGAERRQGRRPAAAPGDGQGRVPAVRAAGRQVALGRVRRLDRAGQYNQAWVDLKRQYQGIVPPVERPATAFDPGAKYHIPASVPYMRYFLARVLQFQFYKSACEQAGWTGPLHRCSFYGNKEVGAKLNAMLAMGASQPWPDALEAFTGSREISGEAMAEYFAPLKAWLDEQNRGKRRAGRQARSKPVTCLHRCAAVRRQSSAARLRSIRDRLSAPAL
jgi:peptidyl-dipeptidase A